MEANIELHVHPFLGDNSIVDVVRAMDKTRTDVLGLEVLDGSIHQKVKNDVLLHYPGSVPDPKGIKLPNGSYLLNAREYNTKEGIHVLTIGYSMDQATPQTEIRSIIENSLENDALVLLDHPYIDNIRTRTAGHITPELEDKLVSICKEYSGQITLEWNGYCIPWIRRVLKNVLNLKGNKTEYHDVNKKAEELADKLKAEGYNVPLLADTDLHGRTKRSLLSMGTSRFVTDVEGDSASEVLASMKKSIFQGDYVNVKKYVSTFHLLRVFCFPIIMPEVFKKPRS